MTLNLVCKHCNLKFQAIDTGIRGVNGANVIRALSGQIINKSRCLKCRNIAAKSSRLKFKTKSPPYSAWEHTPPGILMRKYRNMKSRVDGIQKNKAHLYFGLDILTKEEFYKWAYESDAFWALYRQWVISGYDRKLNPTVDRIDSAGGYVPENMQWLTHSENSSKGAKR